MRPGDAVVRLVICPKFTEVKLPFGGPYGGEFSVLKKSQRIWSRIRSRIANTRPSFAFRLLNPGAVKFGSVREPLPKV